MNNNIQLLLMKMKEFIRTKKIAVLVFGIFVVLIISVIAVNSTTQMLQNPSPQISTYPGNPETTSTVQTSIKPEQQTFRVIKTIPDNNEANVHPGEIEIIFETDADIVSPDSFSLSITPQLPYYWKISDNFPTNTVTTQVYGGLQKNTRYMVSVKDSKQKTVYSWSFTTSNEEPDGSSAMTRDQEEQKIKQYYPLFDYIPYNSADFNLDYTDKLTLLVEIKNPDTAMVRQEALDWIRNHGVDPATHKINFQNIY